jgi:acetyl esterase/lipase
MGRGWKGRVGAVTGAVVLSLLTIPGAARAADAAPPVVGSGSGSGVVVTNGWYASDPADTISLYEPEGTGPFPAIVFVHGGAWGRAQPNAYELGWARALAAAQHWVVAVIGYPTKVAREQVVEPKSVALAIGTVSRRPKVDLRRIALWGESAGGQLALLAAYRDAQRLHPLVSAVVSISGPTDMVTEYSSLAQTALGAVTRFEGLTPAEARRVNSARYRDTSPVNLVGPGDPPTFQAISRHDRLVPAGQVDRLDRLLANVNVAHQTVRLAGHAHSTTLESKKPAGATQTVQELAISFLTQAFAKRRVSL